LLLELGIGAEGVSFATMMVRQPQGAEEERAVVLMRAPMMPMLVTVDDDANQPILFRAFKSPVANYTPAAIKAKTLGARRRGPSMLANIPPAGSLYRDLSTGPGGVEKKPAADINTHKLVLWTPPPGEEGKPVEVDSDLSRVLREHQRVGVQFMFDCLMGLKDFTGYGCILADDMGLGKTLQSITVIWTLLSQGITPGRTVEKAVVVCPASLVKNWGAEFDKWLNQGPSGTKIEYVACAETSKEKVECSFRTFRYGAQQRVLIASYETFRGHLHLLEGAPIGLIVCDEAHRLKNEKTKTAQAINALPAKRRLLLSGTPIQNDLDEFFALVTLANPNIFGEAGQFRKKFALPILRGREPDASEDERSVGQERLVELSAETEKFILRRTNVLNARFLPPKLLLNVFCPLTPMQIRLYRKFVDQGKLKKMAVALEKGEVVKLSATTLQSITSLKNLCNHPSLIRAAFKKLDGDGNEEIEDEFRRLDDKDKGLRLKPVREQLSGKLLFVTKLLRKLRIDTKDRIVVISNYTTTLDLMERICELYSWPCVRLDGKMNIGARHKLVTNFNDPISNSFVFLLSSKAGGCGINLIGANRLVMFDPDWNPANDKQAMARVWREGQKKECFIYRLFATGTIEEKVFQRQVCKDGLSSMLVTDTDDNSEAQLLSCFSSEQVMELFMLKTDTACDTHDMFECTRCYPALVGRKKKRKAQEDEDEEDEEESEFELPPPLPQVAQDDMAMEDDLRTWAHHSDVQTVPDPILIEANELLPEEKELHDTRDQLVSFVMTCKIEFSAERIAMLEADDARRKAEREKANKMILDRAAQKLQALGDGKQPTLEELAAKAAGKAAAAPPAAKAVAEPAAEAEDAQAAVEAEPAPAADTPRKPAEVKGTPKSKGKDEQEVVEERRRPGRPRKSDGNGGLKQALVQKQTEAEDRAGAKGDGSERRRRPQAPEAAPEPDRAAETPARRGRPAAAEATPGHLTARPAAREDSQVMVIPCVVGSAKENVAQPAAPPPRGRKPVAEVKEPERVGADKTRGDKRRASEALSGGRHPVDVSAHRERVDPPGRRSGREDPRASRGAATREGSPPRKKAAAEEAGGRKRALEPTPSTTTSDGRRGEGGEKSPTISGCGALEAPIELESSEEAEKASIRKRRRRIE